MNSERLYLLDDIFEFHIFNSNMQDLMDMKTANKWSFLSDTIYDRHLYLKLRFLH